jgi:CubicO group peptidase (beta-lactamase class C family)
MARTRYLRLGASVVVIVAAIAGWRSLRERDLSRVPVQSLDALERELELLRAKLRIPGMSAAIAEGDRVVWARGFGMANKERGVAATSETIYHLASSSKPFGAVIVLQLVEEGRLRLDDPVSRFGITMERSAPVQVWHLLSHTSGEPPGTRYRYDGNAFGQLTRVIERTTGRHYARELADRIIRRLGLTRTAPNPGEPRAFWSLVASLRLAADEVERGRAAFAASGIDRGPIEAALAQGYARAWGRWVWPSGLFGPMRAMPHGFLVSATGGVVASAADVARFSIALDGRRLLSDTMRALAWQPRVAPNGKSLPYALGWFVQEIRGCRIVWHYGHGLESSSLIVKIPERHATFVILANSDGLSRWRGLGDKADVKASPAATLFLNWYFARMLSERDVPERANPSRHTATDAPPLREDAVCVPRFNEQS